MKRTSKHNPAITSERWEHKNKFLKWKPQKLKDF
jgi:hypothetical protein